MSDQEGRNMKKRVGVLHTSFVFLNVETSVTDLLEEVLPEAEIVHFVDSDVLATVMREEGISEKSTSRMVHLAQAAQDAEVDVIFSACSSLGPAMEVARRNVDTPVVRIDDGMARKAVEVATRIGVLATVPTTLGPTVDLIEQKAAEREKEIEVHRQLSEGAFGILMGGDKERHDEMVVESAKELAPSVEILVLAQASMTRLAPRLEEETGLEVLSSPRLGVEYVRQVLQSHAERVPP